MLSFMNLGGRKKRRRGSKRGRASSGATVATARLPMHNSSRNSSDSFMSPETILRIGIDETERKGVDLDIGKPRSLVGQKLVVPEWPSARKEDRSPALQLEFHHEPWTSQFPRNLLQSRNGSMSSMDELMKTARPRRGQGSTSSIDLPKISNSPNTSRRAMPIPPPIGIPILNSKVTVSQPPDREGPSSLAPPSSYHPPNDDDGDMDKMSTISGMSAARDAFNAFSFASTPGTQYDLELPPDQFPDAERSGLSRRPSSRSRDRLKHRTVRQDSATLPRDFNWTERPKSGQEDPRRSSSASRKSSMHSLWKRNAVAEQELGDALKEVLKSDKVGKGSSQADFQPGSSSTRSRSQPPAPPPPLLTPGAQKLDKADQAALHRVSRVVEVPTPPSSPEKPRRQQGMNKTSSTSLAHSARTFGSVVSSRPATSRSVLTNSSPPPSSASKSSKSPTPTAVQSAVNTGSSSSFSTRYTTVVPPSARTKLTIDEGTIEDQVQKMDFVSFLDDFQFSSPANTPSHNDLLNDAILRQAQALPSLKSQKSRSRSSKSRDTASSNSSFLRLRAQKKSDTMSKPLTTQTPDFTFGTANSGKSRKSQNDEVLDISSERSIAKAKSREFLEKALTTTSSSRSLRPEPEDYEMERRRPSLPQLHTGHSDVQDEDESSSARSPDLLDMLIPNGNIVSPISSTRRKLGRKRSGSTPNPIKLMRSNTGKYRDGGMPFTLIREMDIYDVDECAPTPTTTLDHGQTFPETPRAFSPILTADFPMEDVYPSVSNVLAQVREAFTESEPELGRPGRRSPPSPASPILDTRFGHKAMATEADNFGDAADDETVEEKLERISKRYSRPKSYPSTLNSSPPISPLDLPPLPPLSPDASLPSLRNEPLTPAPNGIPRPLPIVDTIIAPPQRRVGTRPRLPFGPRKPNQASLTQPPVSLLSSFYGSAPASLNGSPDASHLAHSSETSTPPATAPSFRSTPIRWRGYTYDVAQWVLSSSDLQSIVSRAIRQSSNPSNVRILTLDVLDRELPEEEEILVARKHEIENNYKVQVRKRRTLISYLSGLGQTPLASKGDICASAGRLAEEISEVTNYCDGLAEELLEISDQLGQIKKLREVHSASAFNMALRKLYAKYTSQVEENRSLREEVSYLKAESDMAWKQAEDLVLDLDSLSTTYGDPSDAYGVSDSATVKTASRRSSRVSLSRKSMRRASRLSVRNSSVSSLRVNLSSGVRSTFSSDTIPPVPPLPEYRNSAISDAFSNRNSSYERRRMLSGLPPSRAEDIQRMEREIFNMLDPDHRRESRAGSGTPARRQSVIGAIYHEDEFETMRQSHHVRNRSLPSLPLSAMSTTYNI